jgi:TRAP-type C4-dicarboxylate transport system permease small subunit
MKKTSVLLASLVTFLVIASPVYAQSAEVDKIESFIQNVIQILVTLAGFIAAGFFVWGGIGYITSSGHPEALDRSKKTIYYSAVGLTVVLAAFVLSSLVTDVATEAFGTGQ